MDLTPSERRKRFLEFFFSEDNHNLCTMDSIFAQNGKQEKIRPWAERMMGEEPKETILPFVDQKTKQVTWYGLAFTDTQFHRLGEHLNHFIGASYSTFDGRRSVMNGKNLIERAVHKITSGRVYRFQAENISIWKALEMMRHVWKSTPKRKQEVKHDLGLVLRELYLALHVGNRQGAEDLLKLLIQQRFLSAQNELFLQVALLQAFQDWLGLKNLMEENDLLTMRRPLHVTGALIEAVYQLELKPFETGKPEDAIRAIEHFRDAIWPRYQMLYGSFGYLNTPEVLKSAMLRAVAILPQNRERCNELFEQDLQPIDRMYMQQIATFLTPPVEEQRESVEEAALVRTKRLIERGSFDEALEMLLKEPESYEKVMQLFACAFDLQTLEAKEAAYAGFLHLSAEETDKFLQFRINRQFLQELEVEFSPQSENMTSQVPRNWAEWLEQLDLRGPLSNRQLAEQGAREWSPDDMFLSDDDVDRFVKSLECGYEDGPRQTSLNYAFPHMLAFFQKDQRWPRPELSQVYLGLLRMLTLTANGGEDERIVFSDLAVALLANGLNAQNYNELIDCADYLWDKLGSISMLDWALELLEMLVLYPCPNQEIRLKLLYAISRKLPHWQERVTGEQWRMLQCLHRDLDQEVYWTSSVLPLQAAVKRQDDEEDSQLWDKLHGKTIGVYTLTESVAFRVKEFLEEQVPNLRVMVNCDKAGSDALQHMARMSDIMIVSWASAKHAATLYIKQYRPSEFPTLYPRGKGSSSVVTALHEYLKEPAASK